MGCRRAGAFISVLLTDFYCIFCSPFLQLYYSHLEEFKKIVPPNFARCQSAAKYLSLRIKIKNKPSGIYINFLSYFVLFSNYPCWTTLLFLCYYWIFVACLKLFMHIFRVFTTVFHCFHCFSLFSLKKFSFPAMVTFCWPRGRFFLYSKCIISNFTVFYFLSLF